MLRTLFSIKKIATLLLVSTLCVNFFGYYVLLADQKEHNWVETMQHLATSKYEIIKVNINPYGYIVDSGFETVNKNRIINNKVYHVFKSRVRNNVLELYCLKNKHSSAISKNLRNTVQNDSIDISKHKNSSSKKMIKSLSDFISFQKISFQANYAFSTTQLAVYFHKKPLLSGYFISNYLPPDAA